MSHQLAFLNGLTLKTIRERRGVSKEYLCSKARIQPSQLEKWEQCSETDYPTMKQAESMAKVLLCPLAGFYLEPSNLPMEQLPSIVNKRRVQDAANFDESALKLAVVQLIQIRLDAIEIAAETKIRIENACIPNLDPDFTYASLTLRSWLDCSIEEQIRSTSSRKLFLLLRARLEQHGILIAQFNNVEITELRGMALYFDFLPIIGVNAKDHWPAKCFTLIHELVHLSKRRSTYCNLINQESEDEEEVFCNAVAGEYLFSRACALKEVGSRLKPIDVESIERIAKRYSVSRDVVARRLRDCCFLNKEEYEELLHLFELERIEELERRRSDKELGAQRPWSPSYERNVADTFGALFCELMAQGLSTGLFSEHDVCSAFNVSSKGLEKVFKEALQ